ncbi:response regulator [Coleofasciculus sp.]|uniref:response regulator n=1 Tax=Coleofasciculus sp. TaxID=3100458 RepID=UPI0039F890F0
MWTVLANQFLGSYIPHGHCYLWQPRLVWLHLLSDSLTALAYYSIPVTLVYFVHKRQDLPFDWMFWLFSAFILACGTSHIMDVWTLWHPDYWVSGVIKAITAIVSLSTAVLLVQLIPKALALPSPAQLEAVNRQLEQEIRERKTAETQLQHTLKRLTFHVENSPLAVIEWDSDYRIQRWSPQAEQMFGWTVEEAVGRQINELQLIFDDDRDAVNVVMKNLFDARTPRCICCNRNYTKEGSVIDCEWYNSALCDDDDNLVSILSLVLDITSRKQAETALVQVNAELEHRVEERTTQLQQLNQDLEQERQQLRQIITVAPVAMAMFDRQMRYLAHSQQWLTAYGLNEKSLINRCHYDIFPDLPEPWREDHQRALQGEIITKSEDVWQRADGKTIYEHWAIHPWYTPTGEVGGIVLACFPINELVEAREAALATARLKSKFLANMSHEIRTPINGVLGMMRLLLQTHLNPQQVNYTRTIESCAKHLLTVINDILDVSKLEAGKMLLEQIDFSLDSCLDSVIDVLAVQAEAKGLELAILVEPNVPRQLQGDPGRLRQILLNLVGNAIKFTDAGEVVVRVAVSGHQPTDTLCQSSITLRFAVTDTGIGISAADQSKLFQAFSQVEASTTRRYGGTGLGLMICQQLVELLGGKIGVKSEISQGSTFWFTVPVKTQPLPPAQAVPWALRQLKILVTAENATTRQTVRSLVEAWGMQIDEATDSTSTMDTLRNAVTRCHPYDVAILDLQLPGSQGEWIVPMIRCNPSLASTKLIVMTTMHQLDAVQELESMDILGYLIKPVKASQLWESLLGAVTPEKDLENWQAIIHQPTRLNHPSNLKILLVEDHPVNQTVILNQMQMLGYEPECASNGSEALAKLQAQSYDIVFMDCQMPVLDGYDATRELRRQEGSNRHTIVIALTASAIESDREKCLAVGMDDFLTKPFEQATLQAMIERWAKSGEAEGAEGAEGAGGAGGAGEEEINLSRLASTDFYLDDTLFDTERLEVISRGQIILQKQLIQAFMKHTQPGLEQMYYALQIQDFEMIEQQAHRLKGASANIGVRLIPKIAAQLEQQARDKSLIGANERLDSLKRQLEKVQTFLLGTVNLR